MVNGRCNELFVPGDLPESQKTVNSFLREGNRSRSGPRFRGILYKHMIFRLVRGGVFIANLNCVFGNAYDPVVKIDIIPSQSQKF